MREEAVLKLLAQIAARVFFGAREGSDELIGAGDGRLGDRERERGERELKMLKKRVTLWRGRRPRNVDEMRRGRSDRAEEGSRRGDLSGT